ncbi:MAG: exodeoxyribonuclease VII small subunit [Anaerolineaceae bacterium]|nr:MAG: exodeoxyribonuclease VII small subunit [Anaerolineaceae bacterium]
MSDTSANSFDGLSFEDAYTELEKLVARLESGELTLEQSVDVFERGRGLTAYCQQLLDAASLRVDQIADDGGLSPHA